MYWDVDKTMTVIDGTVEKKGAINLSEMVGVRMHMKDVLRLDLVRSRDLHACMHMKDVLRLDLVRERVASSSAPPLLRSPTLLRPRLRAPPTRLTLTLTPHPHPTLTQLLKSGRLFQLCADDAETRNTWAGKLQTALVEHATGKLEQANLKDEDFDNAAEHADEGEGSSTSVGGAGSSRDSVGPEDEPPSPQTPAADGKGGANDVGVVQQAFYISRVDRARAANAAQRSAAVKASK